MDSHEASYQPPFCPMKYSYREYIGTCHGCKESYGVSDGILTNHEVATAVMRRANNLAVKTMLLELGTMNISESYMEGVFELPAGTMHQWELGSYSPGDLAFLRLIRACPGLLLLAKNRYLTQGVSLNPLGCETEEDVRHLREALRNYRF